ncbi:ABC transporter ATP-binding protein, partial [bacterium]|nr:ABC transporter ATP-binding protein [bacterium]
GALVERPTFIENLTGFENLHWFGSLNKPTSRERVSEVLKQVGLKDDAASSPFGVYSTGMKQRLGVASAILHRPSLIVLDEPTSGMDPQGRAHMREILREIHKQEGTTIFLSSHLLDEVQRLCDYVAIIDHGRTVREGHVHQLLDHEEETWEIRLPSEEIPEAIKTLSSLSEVFSAKNVPGGIEVNAKPSSSAVINKTLILSNFKVSALIPKGASLEETFLALTSDATE